MCKGFCYAIGHLILRFICIRIGDIRITIVPTMAYEPVYKIVLSNPLKYSHLASASCTVLYTSTAPPPSVPLDTGLSPAVSIPVDVK